MTIGETTTAPIRPTISINRRTTSGIENRVIPTRIRTFVAPVQNLAAFTGTRSNTTNSLRRRQRRRRRRRRRPTAFTLNKNLKLKVAGVPVGEILEPLHRLTAVVIVITLVYHRGNPEVSARKKDRGIIAAKTKCLAFQEPAVILHTIPQPPIQSAAPAVKGTTN